MKPLLFSIIGAALFVSGCAEKPDVQFKKTSFDHLKGWENQDFSAVRDTFMRSCEVFLKKKPDDSPIHNREKFGSLSDWQSICKELLVLESEDIKSFFERRFQPFEVWGKGNGLMTGYYQPKLEGSFEKTDEFKVPLHALPHDLIRANLGLFDEELKGKHIVGQIRNNRLVPYATRAEISTRDGAPVLLWLKSEIDAFFLHIQGSGQVVLRDGSVLHVAYAGHNGHKYTPIGKVLIEKGEMARDEVSMQTLQTWLESNPGQRHEIFNANARYIFFKLANEGPKGSQGVVLKKNLSAAVDPSVIQLGAPIYLDTTRTADDAVFQRLMVAQDTGAAIKGAARADIYFGDDEKAELYAGKQNSPGRMYILVPR